MWSWVFIDPPLTHTHTHRSVHTAMFRSINFPDICPDGTLRPRWVLGLSVFEVVSVMVIRIEVMAQLTPW